MAEENIPSLKSSITPRANYLSSQTVAEGMNFSFPALLDVLKILAEITGAVRSIQKFIVWNVNTGLIHEICPLSLTT
jgi:hypothetical protein